MVLVHETPHLNTVGKVLLSRDDIIRAARMGSRAWDALASAIQFGRFTSDDPSVVLFVTKAERSSGSHLARKEARKCQRPA